MPIRLKRWRRRPRKNYKEKPNIVDKNVKRKVKKNVNRKISCERRSRNRRKFSANIANTGRILDRIKLEEIDIKTFSNIFKDKKVALVGPSSTLEGKGNGDYIDSFDIVCRINLGFFIPEDMRKDFGKRCDILFSNTNLCDKDILIEFLKNNKDVKWILTNNNSIDDTFKYCLENSCFKIENILFINENLRNKFDTLCNQFNFENKRTIGINSGVMALLLIIFNEASNVFLSGFDFYQQEKSYCSFYPSIGNPNHKHYLMSQMRLLKVLSKENENILELDDFLKELINDDLKIKV